MGKGLVHDGRSHQPTEKFLGSYGLEMEKWLSTSSPSILALSQA